ncbi:MAG: hypothetical protein HY905_08860 [Deltaproteobacteria bacterium]|nr:hypothetical protein [Deltaproteobacteria bacterium]
MLEILLELLVELGLTCLLEGSGRAVSTAYRRSKTHPVLWTLGLFAVGAFLGWLSAHVVPHHLAPIIGFRGFSLLVAPLVVGAVMHGWGRHREARDLPHSGLATFHGGAAFAFGISLLRLLGTS